jgi:hypothetical protein
LDLADRKQRLFGRKTLNLLNSHEDPSFLSTVLYSHIARQYIPCPKANFVKVVINGESWGVYVNVEQFNKDFTREHFHSEKGARWKVNGSPMADGGLRYLGENIEEYKRRYEIKSKDDPENWKALIELCRVLDRTRPEELEQALAPILAIDEVLWFLALDVALCNSDGYWTRASDYTLYRDENGRFHVIPHDFNEAFRGATVRGPRGFGPPRPERPEAPFPAPDRDRNLPPRPPADEPAFGRRPPQDPPAGFVLRGSPPGDSADLDPLVGWDDPRKPLRSKLLAVPSLRRKYLENVRTIAEKSLDGKTVGPVIEAYRSLIEREVEADTKKLMSLEAFRQAHGISANPQIVAVSLPRFLERRREFLLNHPSIQELRRAASNRP